MQELSFIPGKCTLWDWLHCSSLLFPPLEAGKDFSWNVLSWCQILVGDTLWIRVPQKSFSPTLPVSHSAILGPHLGKDSWAPPCFDKSWKRKTREGACFELRLWVWLYSRMSMVGGSTRTEQHLYFDRTVFNHQTEFWPDLQAPFMRGWSWGGSEDKHEKTFSWLWASWGQLALPRAWWN